MITLDEKMMVEMLIPRGDPIGKLTLTLSSYGFQCGFRYIIECRGCSTSEEISRFR
jgi:hypothetical protein